MNDEQQVVPTKEMLEAHFRDDHGASPIDPSFDAPDGALCGNGMRFYHLPLKRKPLPEGWQPPPLPGSDPDYEGPAPTAPFKESPYAIPARPVVMDRKPAVDHAEPTFARAVTAELAGCTTRVGFLTDARSPTDWILLSPHDDRLEALEPEPFREQGESALAQSLLARGIGHLLIDRVLPAVRPWTEEELDRPRLRLRDNLDLGWFHPVVIGSGWILYRIAPPFRVEGWLRPMLTGRVRRLLTGEATPAPRQKGKQRVLVSLRMRDEPKLKGRKLAKRMAAEATVAGAVDRAARRIVTDWAKIREANKAEYDIDLPPTPAEIIARCEIEIEVLYDLCLLTDRTPTALGWALELGVHGLLVRDVATDTAKYLEPGHAVHMGISSPVVFLETLFRKAGLMQFLRPPRRAGIRRDLVLYETVWGADHSQELIRFSSVSWIEDRQAGGVINLYRGYPLRSMAEVTRETMVHALELGADWLIRNQTPDGQYGYKYTPGNRPGRRWLEGGNIVRHALNPYTLLLVNEIAPRDSYVESARRGIDFTLKFLRWDGRRCVVCHRDPPAPYYNAKLGTNAVAILSILKLAECTGTRDYEEAMLGLAEELLYMQDRNGHFRQFDVPPEHPYYGAENTIAPGEFLLALARLYRHTGDRRYLDSADRGLAFYLEAWRAGAANRSPQGIYDEETRVNLVGIVPWFVMAMNDLHEATGDRRYADIGLELEDWIEDTFFYYPHRCRYDDYLGASFKFHGELPAINSCQYIEGASAALAIAKRLGTGVEQRTAVVMMGVRFCLQLQYQDYGTTFFLPEPDVAMGGFRYALNQLHLRNDYSYHAMAALAQSVKYLY